MISYSELLAWVAHRRTLAMALGLDADIIAHYDALLDTLRRDSQLRAVVAMHMLDHDTGAAELLESIFKAAK